MTSSFHSSFIRFGNLTLPKAFQQQTFGLSTHFVRRHPRKLALPKAFQNQTSFAFGFFVSGLFTKVRFRHSLKPKKPLICMRGFVASIGASLEEFAEDVRAILEARIKSL